MENQIKELRDEIKKQNILSKKKAQKYETLECWSYAYLSRWVVLEKALKSLYDIYNKKRIRLGAVAWLEYLSGNDQKVPNKIKDFSVQTRNIPNPKFLNECLGTCNKILDVIDSNKKYRPKRNVIAHKADEFSTEKVYLDYRKAVDAAITQLINKLSYKINNAVFKGQ